VEGHLPRPVHRYYGHGRGERSCRIRGLGVRLSGQRRMMESGLVEHLHVRSPANVSHAFTDYEQLERWRGLETVVGRTGGLE